MTSVTPESGLHLSLRLSPLAALAFSLPVMACTGTAAPVKSRRPSERRRVSLHPGRPPAARLTTRRLPDAAPLPAPRIHVDQAGIAALEQALAARPEAETAIALGRLQQLAGRGPEAQRAWARARQLIKAAGRRLSPLVVKTRSVTQFAWRGKTLALTRGVQDARGTYSAHWTRLELWPPTGRSYPAPSLRLIPANGGNAFAFAGPARLWWGARGELQLLDTQSGALRRRLPSGVKVPPAHAHAATSLAVASKSQHLAAIVGRGRVRVWTASGRLLQDVQLTGHTYQTIRANLGSHCEMRSVKVPVEAGQLSLSPRGRYLAIGTNDGLLRLVTVATGQRRKLKQRWESMFYGAPRNPFNRGRPLGLRFDARGHRLQLLQADSSITTWDTRSGRQLRHWQVPCPAAGKAALRRRLGKGGRKVGKWRIYHGRRDAREACFNVYSADLSPDGSRLATAANAVNIFGLKSRSRHPAPAIKNAQHLRYDPSGRRLAVAQHYGGAEVWDLSPPRRAARLRGPTIEGLLADVSPDGRYAAIWQGRDSWSKTRVVSVWDLAARHRLGQLTVWSQNALRFTGDSQALVAGVKDRVELWSLAPWRKLRQLVGPSLGTRPLVVAPTGPLVAIAGYADRRLRIWNRRSGRLRTLPNAKQAQRLGFSRSGSHLVAVGDQGATVWALRHGRIVRKIHKRLVTETVQPRRRYRRRRRYGRLKGDPPPPPPPPAVTRKVSVWPYRAALSSDGKLVAVSERNRRTVRIYETSSGKLRAELKTKYDASTLLFSTDDRELFVAGIGLFGRWRWAAKGPAKLTLLTVKNRHITPRRITLADGEQHLLTFAFDHHALGVWSLATGSLLGDLWPVTGGHWVALSVAGRVDASAQGRETIMTQLHSGAGAVGARHDWGLGWVAFSQPGLIPRLLVSAPVPR